MPCQQPKTDVSRLNGGMVVCANIACAMRFYVPRCRLQKRSEKKLFAALETAGLRDGVLELPFSKCGTVIDIAFPQVHAAVYVDGVYWHRESQVKQRDAKIAAALQQCGWRVVRVTDIEIKRNITDCVRKVVACYHQI